MHAANRDKKMVSDGDIVRRLTTVLKKADLETTTTTAIRQQLERDLGVDLSDKKAFIRQQVNLYLQNQSQQEQEEGGEEEEQGGGGGGEGEGEGGEEGGKQEEDEGEDQEKEEEEEDDVKPSSTRGRGGEPDSKRLRAKIDRAIKESLSKDKKKRASNGGGLSKVCGLSPELQAIIGESELPRTQVVKQLWIYIRANNLQDPDNKRKIICNDALRTLFGIDSTDMFKMNKLLSRHIWPLENGGAKAAKRKVEDTDTEDAEPRPKKQKSEKSEGGRGKSSGFLAPIPISEALAKFLGAEDGMVSRADAVKRMWDYIKDKKLQDPSDKRKIICDSRLQELFGCDKFVGFGITKLLSPHFLKP